MIVQVNLHLLLREKKLENYMKLRVQFTYDLSVVQNEVSNCWQVIISEHLSNVGKREQAEAKHF